MRSCVLGFFILCCGIGLIGCSKGEGKRYRVSGEAHFKGSPIPYGDVLFTPDGEAKNSGPQGIATIRNGKFDTSGAEGKGIAGGPTVIRITGLTKQGGQLLCEYEFKIDLPRSDSTQKFEVPESASSNPNQKTSPEI